MFISTAAPRMRARQFDVHVSFSFKCEKAGADDRSTAPAGGSVRLRGGRVGRREAVDRALVHRLRGGVEVRGLLVRHLPVRDEPLDAVRHDLAPAHVVGEAHHLGDLRLDGGPPRGIAPAHAARAGREADHEGRDESRRPDLHALLHCLLPFHSGFRYDRAGHLPTLIKLMDFESLQSGDPDLMTSVFIAPTVIPSSRLNAVSAVGS